MPDTEGYWISPDGESIKIYEHASYIRDHPAQFGFTKKQVDQWGDFTRDPDIRDAILLQVIGRKWIRVRGYRTYTTFDVSVFNDDSVARIAAHLQRVNAWPNEDVRVYDHRYKRAYDEKAEVFLSGEISQYARNPRRR